jgi:hypothetical protein
MSYTLTRPHLLSLPPGPELDRLVAERVMGWHWNAIADCWYDAKGVFQEWSMRWLPSTDHAACKLVIDWLKSHPKVDGLSFGWTKAPDRWFALVEYADGHDDGGAPGVTPEHACCVAAVLLAMEGKDAEV